MMNLLVFGIILGVLPLAPQIHAADKDETIWLPYTKIVPAVDGKFTSEKEWSDAKIITSHSNGHVFYIQAKQDGNFVYLMFDGVDFKTDPRDDSLSVRYQAVMCLDNGGERSSAKREGVVCFVSTENNEFGNHAMTTNIIHTYSADGNPKPLDVEGYNSAWGFDSNNDPFEETAHLTYEAMIPKNILMDSPGFGFSIYFGSAPDDLVQLTDGVIWPPGSDKDDPSTWGILNLYKPFPPKQLMQKGVLAHDVYCAPNLELSYKESDNVPVCVKPQSKLKLVERGWLKSTQLASEISPGVRSKMINLLENGKVSEFNELRDGVIGRVMFDKTHASSTELSGINLENIALPGAKLQYADLSNANLRDADLSNSNLQEANLSQVDASEARFWNVNLQGANLQDANLRGASFRGTNLQGANLQGADMAGADLPITANLQNTDLRNVKNLPITIQEAKERGAIAE